MNGRRPHGQIERRAGLETCPTEVSAKRRAGLPHCWSCCRLRVPPGFRVRCGVWVQGRRFPTDCVTPARGFGVRRFVGESRGFLRTLRYASGAVRLAHVRPTSTGASAPGPRTTVLTVVRSVGGSLLEGSRPLLGKPVLNRARERSVNGAMPGYAALNGRERGWGAFRAGLHRYLGGVEFAEVSTTPFPHSSQRYKLFTWRPYFFASRSPRSTA